MSTATSSLQTPSAGRAHGAPAGAALRLVATPSGDHRSRHRDRNAFREEEHELQGHALALESTCLRGRAERYAEAIDRGAVLTEEQVGSVLRAFRAYRPFLAPGVRAANDAARRRLAEAVTSARLRGTTIGATNASVA